MTLLSILCVLVFEQLKAPPTARASAVLTAYADFLEGHFNGGERRHGVAAWCFGVVLPILLVLLLLWTLNAIHPLFGFCLTIVLLYFAMGFRQFSHYFTDIQLALRMGELERARQLLGKWRGGGAERLNSSQIAKLSIEQGIIESHRHVFAPLFWFVLLGPAGALLYRLSLHKRERWALVTVLPGEINHFGAFALQAFQLLDWVPVRITAITFAIVGDFEDAIFCWRTQAEQWPDTGSGILLSSGAGALGVRLGLPLPDETGLDVRPELGLGDEADIEHLQSAIGLVWRALILPLLLLALLTVASWVAA